MDFMNWCTDL